MKKFIIPLMAVLGIGNAAMASEAPADTVALKYNIEYQWGFIKKVAGEGNVGIVTNGDRVTGYVDGHSIPWGGKVYHINDSVSAVVTKADGIITEKIDCIEGCYTKPPVGVKCNSEWLANPANYKKIDGTGDLDASAATMEAVTIIAQMPAMFQAMKMMDFESMSPGDIVTVPMTMPSGKTERLEITYNGNSGSYNGIDGVYSLTLNCTYHGKADSHPITCYLDPTALVPLYLSSDLVIGHVAMVLV